jgi:hypothetical protein
MQHLEGRSCPHVAFSKNSPFSHIVNVVVAAAVAAVESELLFLLSPRKHVQQL